MEKSKKIEENFRRDLDSLLKKYNAELEADDDDKPYGLHTPIVKITIHSVYNEKNEQVSPFVVFDL
ncbi:MAG: hypothetical protein M0R03_20700 [Novosphingobium sp.]|jgi:hypothetical protein|nr:hypothetical protein [Novosphingobium sp.]